MDFNEIKSRISLPLVVSIVLILAIIFFWSRFIIPSFNKLTDKMREIKEQKILTEDDARYFANVKDLQEKLKQYPEELSKVSDALPGDNHLPSLFNFLQKTCSQTGLVFQGMSPFSVSSVKDRTFKETKTTVYLFGPYDSLKNFLGIIENSARVIEVESISFSSAAEGGNIKFTLGVKVFNY